MQSNLDEKKIWNFYKDSFFLILERKKISFCFFTFVHLMKYWSSKKRLKWKIKASSSSIKSMENLD